jgi:predicted nucleic acid-binding protein
VRFLDTNIFLRYLAPTDARKASACFDLFQRIKSGQETVTTSEVIIAEVAYVLRSRAHYGLATREISDRLRPLLSLRGLKLAHKETCLKALEVWDANPAIDFEDALTVAHMERLGITELFSYDTDFDRIANVERVEP